MRPKSPNYISDDVWIGIIVTIYTFAIAIGLFRLIHRFRTKLRDWDDCGVAVCLICNVIVFSVLCTLRGDVPSEDQAEDANQFRFRLLWICIPSTLWTSRLSVAFTVLRLIKFDIWRTRLTIVIIIGFTLAWMTIILDYIIECNVNAIHRPDCSSSFVELSAFSVFIIADACLVYIPLRLLRNLRQPRGSRLMVRVAFSVSGISTVATIMNIVSEFYEAPQYEVMEQFTTILNAPFALIACSLIVVIPFIYRLFRKEEEWMISIPTIEISDIGPPPSVVCLPEPVALRGSGIRSFPTLPLPFFHRDLSERGQFHSWPQGDQVELKIS